MLQVKLFLQMKNIFSNALTITDRTLYLIPLLCNNPLTKCKISDYIY